MKAAEHCLSGIDGQPDIYVSGDDDEDSPDLRLSFVYSQGMVWHDMPPKRLADLRDLIDEALTENNAGWKPPSDEEVTQEQQRMDLAMLVGRLIRQSRKHDPENVVAKLAHDYLKRNGLLPSVIDR